MLGTVSGTQKNLWESIFFFKQFFLKILHVWHLQVYLTTHQILFQNIFHLGVFLFGFGVGFF